MNNRTVKGALAMLAFLHMAGAQEVINGGRVMTGPLSSSGTQATVDFSGAASTSPVKSGTLAARGGTCSVGQMYFATDAAAGQNLALCTALNTWTTIAGISGVNAQTGTTYSLQDADNGKLVTFTNASAVGVTLPQAGASSWFKAGWVADVQNRGAGIVTITPLTSTIDGLAALALTQNQGTRIFSDGSNYYTQRGVGGAAAPAGTGIVTVSGGSYQNPGPLSQDVNTSGLVATVVGVNGTNLQAANIYTSNIAGATLYNNPDPCITFTVPYTNAAFKTASAGANITITTVPAKWQPAFPFPVLEETTQFASATVTGAHVSIGTTALPYSFLAASPIMQVSNAMGGSSSGPMWAGVGGPLVLVMRVETTDGSNLGTGGSTNLTAGSLTGRICGKVAQ